MKFAIILFAVACTVFTAPVDDDSFQELVDGNHVFTAAVYKELAKQTPGNLIVSPFSVETVLALTFEGAKGITAAELITGLSLPSTKEKVEKAYQAILPKLRDADSSLKVSIANKIYVEEDVQLEDSFRSVAVNVYGSGVENVDFADRVDTAAEINNWVEEQTNHKIKNLVNPSALSDQTKILLVNALYLSGEWQTPFVKYLGRKENFYTSADNFIEIDVLHNEEEYSYYVNQELDAKFLEMKLKGGDASMVIALPNQIDGLANLEQKIEQVLAPQPFTRQRVVVDVPKFSIESQTEFVPILQNLGIHSLFGPGADLSGLSSNDKELYVGDVVQKAFINVTERGVEAAAATQVLIPSYVIFPTAEFKADHPFLYYIVDNGLILFSGRYVQP